MLRETGRSIGHFKDTSIVRGKKALKLSRRIAKPIVQMAGPVGIIIGFGLLAMEASEYGKTSDSINTRVSEAFPRKVTEEEYRILQREIAEIGNNPRDTAPNFEEQITPIIQENERSQNASELKDQLTKEYKAEAIPRIKRDIVILSLSLVKFFAPFVGNSMVNIYRRHRSKPTSPEPTDP